MTTLQDAIARARAAVQAASGRVSLSALTAEASATAPSVRVRVQLPTPSSAAPPRPARGPTAGELVAGLDLKPAELRAFELLHRLALGVVTARGYHCTPSAAVFHLPASLLAFGLGVSRRHLYRLLPALAGAGLLAHGGHASKVGGINMYDGCLWAVRLRPEAPPPRLRREDWRHSWRDFLGDLKAKRTAEAVMSQLQINSGNTDDIFQALWWWAVNPGNMSPVAIGVTSAPRELVYALPALAQAHAKDRSRLIGEAASALAQALNDRQSRRLYALLLNRAVEAEYRGTPALARLAAAITRLLVDIAEWDGLKRPGALLITRLKQSGDWDALRAP